MHVGPIGLWGRGQGRPSPTPEPYWLKGGLVGIDEGETCPAGLGRRWKHALGGLGVG